jgi:biotin synthase
LGGGILTLEQLANEVIAGRRLRTVSAVLGKENGTPNLLQAELGELAAGADRIRRALCGDKADLCAIVSGKSGRCGEDCKFCAQSRHNHAEVDAHGFLELDALLKDGKMDDARGVDRYSIVTAGRTLAGHDLDAAVRAYAALHEKFPEMKLCGSHGLMSREAFARLKEAGVEMVHCNIETSRRYFPSVCSTHTFDDKLRAIADAKALGLKICCGGIIGMGETWADRIEMALTTAELGVASIPINVLMPIPGTPFADRTKLSPEEVLRTVALFRWINPAASIRMAAGRSLFEDGGSALFKAGANATITGDMLTTVGNHTEEDRAMLAGLGFSLRPSKRREAARRLRPIDSKRP